MLGYSNLFLLFNTQTDEPQYWWFELAVLLNKTLMCGGLVVMSPGTPSQVVCAILIMLFQLLLVLKTAPYEKDSEDFSSIAASLGLTLMYVSALINMLQVEVGYRSPKDAQKLDYANEAMTVLPILCISTVVLIMVFVDCGLWNCLRCKKSGKTKVAAVVERRPANNRIVQRNSLSLKLVRKAVVHDKIKNIETTHADSRSQQKDAIQKRMKQANIRVMERVLERRKKNQKRFKTLNTQLSRAQIKKRSVLEAPKTGGAIKRPNKTAAAAKTTGENTNTG
jgi:hypothetical protein